MVIRRIADAAQLKIIAAGEAAAQDVDRATRGCRCGTGPSPASAARSEQFDDLSEMSLVPGNDGMILVLMMADALAC